MTTRRRRPVYLVINLQRHQIVIKINVFVFGAIVYRGTKSYFYPSNPVDKKILYQQKAIFFYIRRFSIVRENKIKSVLMIFDALCISKWHHFMWKKIYHFLATKQQEKEGLT